MDKWGCNSKLRRDDVRAYLNWQIKALGEALSWYYEESWLRLAGDEHIEMSPQPTLPRSCDEVTVHGQRMLRCGRFDNFDWSEGEDEVQPRKRRRVSQR